MSNNRKYLQDFARCSGEGCNVADKCARKEAREEALDLDIAYGCYLDASDCTTNECCLFVAVEVEVGE